jgi:tetratricopeptide (TPR) repeat protein
MQLKAKISVGLKQSTLNIIISDRMSRVEKLMEYLAATPDDPFLQHALALEFIKQGNDGEAERLFRNVLQKDPAYTGSYYHLGKLLERKGDPTSAIEFYKLGMVMTKQAGDQHAYNELQAALEDLEDES